MIQVGTKITQKEDVLKKVKVEYIYHKLRNPDPNIEAHVRQLRIVKQVDEKQYAFLKRQLPYLVCGIFNPPYRHLANFGYTEYFIVDIDHISDKIISLQHLKQTIQLDNRVMLCFISPSEDGLKILFKLKHKCYDAGIYSLFYKLFVKTFSQQYKLAQVVDTRTSDVTRACFVSVDKDAFFNENAEEIDINHYLKTEDYDQLLQLQKATEKTLSPATTSVIKIDNAPDADTLQHIRKLLNPTAKPLKKEPFVPEQLAAMLDVLLPILTNSGIQIVEVENIQYGKKIKLKVSLKEAEINIFYGKKGYSVVISPRRGTDDELNKLAAEIIQQVINGDITTNTLMIE